MRRGQQFKIHDHGFIELHDVMGGDLAIVNAARQSFGKASESIGEAEKGLINFLMRERHGTPFEMVSFTFNAKVPIFVMREWIRHRIGSFNEYSGRYTKMIEDFYVPMESKIRTQTGKPGAYRFEPVDFRKAKIARLMITMLSLTAYKAYNMLLKLGVAKELARIVLPVNYYTQFTWSVNLRSLLNFISLRSHETAMYEVREYSKAIETLISEVVPVSYNAFIKNGRRAP